MFSRSARISGLPNRRGRLLDLTSEQCASLGRPSAAAGATLAQVAAGNGWHKPEIGGSFAGIRSCELTRFENGAERAIGSDYCHPSFEHPALNHAANLLGTWPEQLEEAVFLWSRIYPIQRAALGGDFAVHGYGCTCGGVAGKPFEIYSTVYDPLGFLEGIVHEFAHWKLHTLGVHLMSWSREFLANDFEALYESPIRKDIERPMAAVVHAHYSYLHVIEVGLRRIEQPVNDFPDIPGYRDGLRTNLGRMIEGHGTLAECVEPGPLGRDFFRNLGLWGLDVIARAQKILD